MLIDICVCTFRRASLEATLKSLGNQIPPTGAEMRIIVADNDDEPSAQGLVESVGKTLALSVIYIHAPSRNISIARNACLDTAKGEWVAFIDDDETAPPDWIQSMFHQASSDNLDAVFGPAVAEYPPETPDWIRLKDYHSNRPETRNGVVQTGHTCNALIRTDARCFTGQRFLLEKGRSGGEDTEFFYRAWHAGARMGIAESAPVYEQVEPGRLRFAWLRKRKFRSGISYGRHALKDKSRIAQASLQAQAALKMVISATVALLCVFSRTPRNYWLLRAVFHAGAFSSGFSIREQELYGEPARAGSPS